MKKSIALMLGIGVVILFLTACSGEAQTFTPEEYTADAATIRRISIDVHDREIDVFSTPDNQIRLSYSQSAQEEYNVVSDGDMLTMTAADSKDWVDYIGVKPDISNRKIALTVPQELLSVLEVCTTNENITLSQLAVRDKVQLVSEGGNIEFADLDVGQAISLSAKNGNIAGNILGSSGDFTIRTDIKKGNCNLPKDEAAGSKTLDVCCNNGDVDIAFEEECNIIVQLQEPEKVRTFVMC